MKKVFSKFILGLFAVSTVIFNGCGGVTTDTKTNIQKSSKQPHKVTRVLDYDADHADDWQDFVDMKASYDESDNNFILNVTFDEGITYDVEHFQIYLDTDYSVRTGYSDSYIKGADYLIEDGSLFKSVSNTEWEWEYVDEVYYVAEESSDGKYHILVDDNGAAATMFSEENHLFIDVSIEPLSGEWYDTHNFINTRDLKLKDEGNGAIAERVSEIEGYELPKPEHDGVIVHWRTLFYDIIDDTAYALSTFGESYPYGTYLSILDVSNIQDPILKTQLYVGKRYQGYAYKALDMYTDRNYSYVFVEKRFSSDIVSSGGMFLINTADKDNPFVVGSDGLCGGAMSLNHIIREGDFLHLFYSDYRGRRHVRYDLNDPESAVQ
jgi:hypothetical protein